LLINVDFLTYLDHWSETGRKLSDTKSVISNSKMEITEYKVQVDETKPITTIAVKLPTGQRIQSKFNVTHTVDDVAVFVAKYVICWLLNVLGLLD
jgi:hypothetical protein